MDNFEWRTDEEDPLAALTPAGEATAATRRRRRLLLLLCVLLLVGGGAYWIYHASTDHIAETSERVEADVRASHELVHRAGQDADLELFQRFLSSADPDWAWAEEQMVRNATWLERSTLDLRWAQTLTPTAAITLSADLLQAEVVSHEAYHFTDASGEVQTATLAQTRVYRRGPDRWLLAPPHPEYWGEEAVVDMSRLRLAFPVRDEALAKRLAVDLNRLIERTYNELTGGPVFYRLSLRFARDAALLQVGEPGTLPLWAERPLVLPAPSLIGRPLDENAYRAMFLGYARPALAAAIAEMVGWRCCQPGLYFQALVEQQWQALGLAPAPPEPPPGVYQQMLQAQVDVVNGSILWSSVPVVGETPALQSVRVIIAFLQQRFPGASAADWQRELASADRYAEWIAAVTGNSGGPALAMGWHTYLYEHAAERSEPRTVEAPADDLLLLCDVDQVGRTLMRFDPQSETFERILEGPALGANGGSVTMALASSGGVFLADHDGQALRIWLWQSGDRQLVWDSGVQRETTFRFLGASPEGSSIVVEENDRQRQTPIYRIAEVATCLDGGCDWRRSIYRPTWSPDGRHVINAAPQNHVLFLAETHSALQPFWYMDVGVAPTWLDDETFAYVRQLGGELASVAITSVGERHVQTLIDAHDLRTQLPPGVIIAPAVGLVRHPIDENVFFLALQTVRSQPPTTTYIFLLRKDTSQLFNLLTVNNGDPASLSIAPAGRWLALQSDEGLVLYDMVADRGGVAARGAQAIDPLWSPSARWLFTGGAGHYYLIAPGEETREVSDGAPSCDAAIWVEGE